MVARSPDTHPSMGLTGCSLEEAKSLITRLQTHVRGGTSKVRGVGACVDAGGWQLYKNERMRADRRRATEVFAVGPNGASIYIGGFVELGCSHRDYEAMDQFACWLEAGNVDAIRTELERRREEFLMSLRHEESGHQGKI